MIVPDTILFNTITKLLDFLKEDWTNQVNKEDSYLYKITNGLKLGKQYDYYTEAQSVFLKSEVNEPRTIDVYMSYDTKRKGLPTIYINLPSEETDKNSLGIGEGVDTVFNEGDFNDTDFDEGEFSDEYSHRKFYERRFNTRYTYTCTSDNRNEVMLMSHIVKTLVIAGIDHFNIEGLENISVGMNDLMANDDLLPSVIYMRSVTLRFEYDFKVPSLYENQTAQSISFQNG